MLWYSWNWIFLRSCVKEFLFVLLKRLWLIKFVNKIDKIKNETLWTVEFMKRKKSVSFYLFNWRLYLSDMKISCESTLKKSRNFCILSVAIFHHPLNINRLLIVIITFISYNKYIKVKIGQRVNQKSVVF